ncbi:PAS domain S-box protein [Limnofasciculus baicalensis]|uniref:histidine kinase n=1 Tax=Limnofasciculus baicalensis BBK-W-15 TaxID=2699891 RepID=A0AAE3GPH2_9CYAN|nr:PAS domain S-box protein [Limnofasciculus baicalensis]MCP2727523.1 PAS domain S-box protein [Limnofasciculus baicalensis BBK-W-15]
MISFKPLKAFITNTVAPVPLHTVLIIPFVLQIAATVGLIGWLSYRNGQEAVNNVADQLRSETTNRIQERLQLYIETPHRLNQFNANAIASNPAILENSTELTRFLWKEIQSYEGIANTYLGSTDGEFRSAKKQLDGTLLIKKAGKATQGNMYVYKTDNAGNAIHRMQVYSKYDPRTRPWYGAAVKAGKPIWSNIYTDFTSQALSITAAQPIYNQQRQLQGVLGSDLIFAQVNKFLQNLKIGKTGTAFIIERSGNLVATSSTALVQKGDRDNSQRIKATESENKFIQQTAKYIDRHFGNLTNIRSSEQLSFEIKGAKQFIQVASLSDSHGLDWLIVVVIPESDFMGQIYTNNNRTIILSTIALSISIGIGILIARRLSKPIVRLTEASKELAKAAQNQFEGGKLHHNLEVKGIAELETLVGSFNTMALQLQESFATLETKNADLQHAKEALAKANEQLEAVLNAVPGSISWVGANGLYLGVNRYLAETLNVPPNLIIGKEVGFFNNSPDYAKFMRQFIASHEESASQIIPIEVNSQERYYLMAVQKYQQGSATVSVGIDITERREAEEALRIAEENYRSIFENALEGIFQSTPDGHYISVNPAMARIHGYDSPEKMIASITQIGSQLYVDPSTRDNFKSFMAATGKVQDFEYQVYRQDGSIIWVEEDTRAVRDTNGRLLYYEGIIQDISKRKREEESLKRQVEELRIEIDHRKRAREVAEITQTDYFQELQAAAERLRFDEDDW